MISIVVSVRSVFVMSLVVRIFKGHDKVIGDVVINIPEYADILIPVPVVYL